MGKGKQFDLSDMMLNILNALGIRPAQGWDDEDDEL